MHDLADAVGERVVARAARGLAAGVALFWLGAVVLVRSEAGVPNWWLPCALLLGLAVPVPANPPTAARGPAPLWRWLAAAALLAALAAVVHGALATPSRHWDGAAAFDGKAFWLTQAPTLQQPFFADPAVFHHSPDYPLLLPLLLASTERLLGGGLGRLWLPALWVLTLLVLAATLRRAGGERRLVLAVVVAMGLTPALLGPGGGAVDSGYADGLLLLATTTLAGGLLLRAPFEVAVGVVLAVASKPEGLVYVAAAAAVSTARGERRLLVVLLLALAGALAAWLPTQRQLLHLPPGCAGLVATVVGTFAGIGLGLWGFEGLVARTRSPARWRLLLLAAGIVAALLLLPWFAGQVPPDSAIGVYLHRGQAWQQGLANLPAVAATFVDHAFLRLHFGATFVAMVLLLGRPSPAGGGRARDDDGARGLALFGVVGLATTALPFVLTHEEDVQHHLRSSLPRLLLHWLGPAWLLIGVRLGAVLATTRAGAATAARPS